MAKAKDAFRTISEVAEWLDTPTHVLRFWESKFSQIKPVKGAGGRRYYRPADMDLLGGIKQLLHHDGLTIKGTQKLLREKGIKHVAALGQSMTQTVAAPALAPEPTPIPKPAPKPAPTPVAPSSPIQDALPFDPPAPAFSIDLPTPPAKVTPMPGRVIGTAPADPAALEDRHADIAPLLDRLEALHARMAG